MSILTGKQIREMGIISPHREKQKYKGMSFGESYAGYDIRLRENLTVIRGESVLGSSVERINVPLGVIGFVHNKSTLARMGLNVFNGVLEPGWRGYVTLEFSYNTPVESLSKLIEDGFNVGYNYIELKAGQPIAQIIFHWINEEVEGYEGKYQDQRNEAIRAKYDNR